MASISKYDVTFLIGIVLLHLTGPFWVNTTMPILPLMLVWMAVGYGISVYAVVYLRAESPTVLTESGTRESASLLTPLVSSSSMAGEFLPMTTVNVGGASAMTAGLPDKNLIYAPRASIEMIGRRLMLIYAPTQPISGYLFQGLAGPEYDIALKAAQSGFLPKHAIVQFSILNTLRGEDTEDLKRQQDQVVMKYGSTMSADRTRVKEGPEAFVQEIRNVARAFRKKSVKEQVIGFFGTAGTQDEEQKERNEIDSQRQT